MLHRVEVVESDRRIGLLVYRWVTPTILRVVTVISLTPLAARWLKWLTWQLPWTTLLYHRRATHRWHHWSRRGYDHIVLHVMP